ncbi:lL-2,4-diaminobutyric acid acetyltransferasee [Bacillus sp. OxB-1]|uniref:diaminobutyrate acetyltransferase n=1 Tax=Bacillus sp. (strain OxB-1) TaxID=98228 RepID=UPI000581C711|nr:diaminobutyrate acetyltransferase [Bacillus sp. OxB-1]BAQ09046.1 lL-2,4-diaminobutyric acid acetyltransferasee [Bacillus sp. OxB-1]
MSEGKESATTLVESDALVFRLPTEEDGKEIWQLIKETGVLDLNSSYSYLMWSKYFDETSIVVEADGQGIVGFISGFIPPKASDTLFIWQVAVDASQRGKGIASHMLQSILRRDACRNIRCLEATVSPSNKASDALFRKLARDLGTGCRVTECFTEEQFPGAGHEAEWLYTIGPFEEL